MNQFHDASLQYSSIVTELLGDNLKEEFFQVNIPPLPAHLDDLWRRITTAINSADRETLIGVWEETSSLVDVVRVEH